MIETIFEGILMLSFFLTALLMVFICIRQLFTQLDLEWSVDWPPLIAAVLSCAQLMLWLIACMRSVGLIPASNAHNEPYFMPLFFMFINAICFHSIRSYRDFADNGKRLYIASLAGCTVHFGFWSLVLAMRYLFL